MRLQDLNNEVLTEAKVAFRDTKSTRDKVFGYFVGTLETKNMTSDMVKFYKDAAKMNKLVKFVADIVGKSKTGTKYTITDADLSKLYKAGIKNRSDLPKKDFNLLGGEGGDTSSKSTVKSVTKTTGDTSSKSTVKSVTNTTTQTSEKPKGIDKDSLKKDIANTISGSVSGDQVEWEKDARVTEREAFRMAERQASGLSKYFDMNRAIDRNEGTAYNDPEWGGYDRSYKYASFAPKPAYKDVLEKLTISGRETGDYSGDWAEAYIRVFFN